MTANGASAPQGWVLVLAWCIRHWFLVLILVGALLYAVVPRESDDPRPGYVDTGDKVTSQQCEGQGGTVVDDVCYGP